MKQALSKFNHFLVYSRRTVPLFFYVFVPLLLRKTCVLATLILAVPFFLYVWWKRFPVYCEKQIGLKRYLVDAAAMTLGVAVLWSVEIFIYRGTDTVNYVLYMLVAPTSVPTMMSTWRIVNSGEKRAS